MKALLLLASVALCLPALRGGETAIPEEETAWTGASYPELPDRPWFALPCYVTWAFEDARGRIWLGSATPAWPKGTDSDLIRDAKARMRAAFTQDRPLLAGAEILHHDAAGRFWIRVRGKKTHVLGYDGTGWVRFPLEIESWNYAQEHLYEDAQGRVWLNGPGAICRFEKDRFETIRWPGDEEDTDGGDYFSRATVLASPDGLVMLSAWNTARKTWLYRDGRVFALAVPPGKPDAREGWDSRWPVDGNAVLHTGYMLHRTRVLVPAGTEAAQKTPAAIRELLTRMDSERFEIREAATRQLREMAWKRTDGRSLIAELLQGEHSTEVTGRLQAILATWDDPRMSRQIADGPWLTAGFLSSAVPRAQGAIVSGLTVRTPGRDGQEDHDEKGLYWIHPDGQRFKVPIADGAGSNLNVRYDGRGAPLIAEWNYGGFCCQKGRFVRATPVESDRLIRSLFAVDARGRAFFNSESDAVFVTRAQVPLTTPWKRWPQADSLQLAGHDQAWVDFETAAVSRLVDGEWSAIQTSEGELNQGRIVAESDGSEFLLKGHLRADPDRFWLLDARPHADRKRPSHERLSGLATEHREALLTHFSAVRCGDLDPEPNRASVTGDADGNLWVVEPTQDGDPAVAVIDRDGAHPLNALIEKDDPGFKRADRVIRLPERDGVVLLHGRWTAEGAAATPLVLRWRDGQLDVQKLYAWEARYGDLAPWSVFLARDGALFLGKGGYPGALRVRGERVEFLPDERPPVLEHPHGTLWYQDLTGEAYPHTLGLKALLVRRGEDCWRIPLRCTAPRSAPVVDRKGLVWIGLGNGVVGMAVTEDGVRVVHEIPWDLPGRTVYDLLVDAQNSLWGYDRRGKEALRLELDALPGRSP